MIAGGKEAITAGVALSVFYTLLITGADAITKLFSANYAAPQLFAISGGLVALFCILASTRRSEAFYKTSCPGAMAMRAVATVIGTCAFFYAFKLLPFAEVFLFIAIIPILAAVMSGMALNERATGQMWIALLIGVFGMLCLFPGGLGDIGLGHLVALVAVLMGAVSMVASRYIGQRDAGGLLPQVFYPNLALMITMGMALPFVYQPMGWADLAWVVQYAVLLFAARWVLVAALKQLPAFIVTPLMNLQFVWMVAIGALAFGEMPGPAVFAGAAMLVVAGFLLVWGHMRDVASAKAMPAE